MNKIPTEIIYNIVDYLDKDEVKRLSITCSRLFTILAPRIWQVVDIDLTQTRGEKCFGRYDLQVLYNGVVNGKLTSILESVKYLNFKVYYSLDETSKEFIKLVGEHCKKVEKVRVLGCVSRFPSEIVDLLGLFEEQCEVNVCLDVDTSWKSVHTIPNVKNLILKFQRDRYETGLVLPDKVENLSIYGNRINQPALIRMMSGLALKKLHIDCYILQVDDINWVPSTVWELRLDVSELRCNNQHQLQFENVRQLHAALTTTDILENMTFPNLELLNLQCVPPQYQTLPVSPTNTNTFWTSAELLTNRTFRNAHNRFDQITQLVIYGIETGFPYHETLLHTFPNVHHLYLFINTDADEMHDCWLMLQGLLNSHNHLSQVCVHAPEWDTPVEPQQTGGLKFFPTKKQFLNNLDLQDESELFGGPPLWID